ncbi:MAG: hypothetical protein ACRDHF_17510 [Tepidiformaceae bacterium]
MTRRTETSGWWGEATTDSLSHRFISVSVVAAALVAWYAITAAHIVRPLYLPRPQAVLELFAAERWSRGPGLQ